MPEIHDHLYQYHKRGGNVVTWFAIKQEVGTTSYYQFMNNGGYWYVMKQVRSTVTTTYTYTAPVVTSASDGWTGKAALTYTNPNTAFAEG